MRSGCPHSQGGAYPAFQLQSNVCLLTSPQNHNVSTVPVVCPADGVQYNMVATPYPGEFSVAHSPTQWQQGNAQSQQNFQGLHQLESVCANENSVRQSVYNSGQQRHCNMQKESNLNIDTGLQHRQNLNFAFSVGTSSAALQGDGLGIAAQTFHSLTQCSSLPESKKQRSNPLDYKDFVTTPSLSGGTNAKMDLNTSTHFSDERHCKSQQVKCSLTALNCGKTRTQNLDHSGGTNSTPCQQQASSPSPSPSNQSYPEKVLQIGEMVSPTDDDIQAFILRSVVEFTTQNKRNNGHAHSYSTCPSGCMPKSISKAHHPKTSVSDKDDMDLQILNCAVIEQCTSTVGQAPKESSAKDIKTNTELTPTSKESGACATSASKKHSTEYPQIIGNVAASCTKNEDESPVVIITVPSVKLDELTEKHPSSSLNCSSSQEQYKSLGENINKNLDDTEQMPGVSWPLKHMKDRDKGDTGLKPVDAVWMDNVQGVTDVLEDLKTKSSSVASENKISEPTSFTENQEKKIQNTDYRQQCNVTCQGVIAHCKLNSSAVIQIHNVLSIATNQSDQLCNQTSYEGAREDRCSVYPQTDVEEQAPLSKGEGKEAEGMEGSYGRFLKEPRYEDISENEDMSQLDTKLPVPEFGDLSVSTRFEDLKYEDISEDENPQTDDMTVERPLLTQAPESDNMQSSFKKEKYGHVQCQVLKDEDETDEMSDNWIVIPISISDLRFEPEDEDCKNQEKVVLIDGASGDKTQLDTGPTHHDPNRPAPPPSSQIEVFDTRESFLKAQGVQLPSICEVALDCHTTEHETDALGEPQNQRDSGSEAEESSETEDSYDYSSGSEHNFLTPSRKSWNKRSVADEKKDEDDEVEQKTDGQKTSKNSNIIIIDSDTEDESDQNCKKRAESKRWFSGSDSNEHPPYSQQKRHSPEIVGSRCGTVKKKFKKKRPAPQHQSTLHDAQFKEMMQAVTSDLSHSTEKNGQLIKTKGVSDHVQHNAQKSSKNERYGIIILDSDTESVSDQNCNKVRFSSGSAEGDDAPCVQQRTHSAERVDSETAKEKLREAQLSSADSSLPQHKSKRHYSQFKAVTQDACSDLVRKRSHGTEKSRQLVEAKSDSEHVQHKTNRPRIPEQRGNTKKRLSGSEDNALFAIKSRHSAKTVDSLCRTTNKKPKTTRLSSEDFQKKQPQSVEKEADSTLGLNPLIPHFVIQKSSQPTECLKLLKKSTVCMQGDDKTRVPKTPTETSKRTDLCEKNTVHPYRNKKGRFEKPANDRNHSTKNKVQAIVEKSKISFPSQESPALSVAHRIVIPAGKLDQDLVTMTRAPRQRHNSPQVSKPTETRFQQVRGEVLNPSRTPSEKGKAARHSHPWTSS